MIRRHDHFAQFPPIQPDHGTFLARIDVDVSAAPVRMAIHLVLALRAMQAAGGIGFVAPTGKFGQPFPMRPKIGDQQWKRVHRDQHPVALLAV